MNEEKKAKWIIAIDSLIEAYRANNTHHHNCPLCPIAEEDDGCGSCLWNIIDKTDCSSFARAMGYKYVPEQIESCGKYYLEWKKIRIRRLKQWKQILISGDI